MITSQSTYCIFVDHFGSKYYNCHVCLLPLWWRKIQIALLFVAMTAKFLQNWLFFFFCYIIYYIKILQLLALGKFGKLGSMWWSSWKVSGKCPLHLFGTHIHAISHMSWQDKSPLWFYRRSLIYFSVWLQAKVKYTKNNNNSYICFLTWTRPTLKTPAYYSLQKHI